MLRQSSFLSTFALAVLPLFASAELATAEVLVPVSSVSANGPNTFPSNPPSVLVNGAQGDYNYVAPNPGSGGGGTSWHTPWPGWSPVSLTFNFGTTAPVDEVVLWDYYGHTPQLWTLKLFSGAGGTGATLLSYDFAIGAGNYDAQRWNVTIPTTLGVNSAQLVTRNGAQWDGVGLAEVAFVAAVPQPTSGFIFVVGCFIIALCTCLRRCNSMARV
jgi:hypothetical protein